MVSERKKKYMKKYNKKPKVKARKAEHMRKIRKLADKEATHKLVRFLLDVGYENLAFEYAQERAPEMLATVKARPARKK